MHILEFGLPKHFRGGPAGVTIAGWLLRVAVLGFAIGALASVLGQLGSGLGTYFFLEMGYTHPQVAPVERMVAYALLAFAIAAVIWPHWVLVLPITILVTAEACAHYINGGFPFAEWVIYAYALRIGTPLALLVLCFAPLGRWIGPVHHLRVTGWVLRIAIAIVFAVHGTEALMQHPRFIDFIIGTTHNFTGHYLAESTVVWIMRVIGVVDIIVAILVIVKPHPAVLYWMAFWGLITALSRVTTYGIGHHYEVFVRTAHFLAPIALLFVLNAQAAYGKDRQKQSRPDTEARELPGRADGNGDPSPSV